MAERGSEHLEDALTPDAKLADALSSTVEDALIRAVRRNPRLWAEAIFPIVLPAIRMAVAAALRDAIQSLNQVLDQSFSLKSLRWRLESWRTGKPFSEVVLLRTLVYRVEQVLLIDRKTGLLLLTVVAPDVVTQDAKVLSAMLTAIQDFVHESFHVEKDAQIRELHVGDFSLWIEQGSHAVIAAAVRGNANSELRETLRAAIDLVHQEFNSELHEFRGDSAPFERCRPVLEGCLQARYGRSAKPSNWKAAVCLASLAMLAILWVGFRIQQARQWERFLNDLEHMPGIVITRGAREDGGYALEGFRDPLAVSPHHILTIHGIDPRKVSMHFRPFLSLDPELILQRARHALHPPDSVAIAMDRDVISLRGTASHEWILGTRHATSQMAIPGITEVRTGDLRDRELESLRSLIEQQAIDFPEDSSLVGSRQAHAAHAIAAQSLQWIRKATAIGMVPHVLVIGYGDADDSPQMHHLLAAERAGHIADLLRAASVPRDAVQVVAEENPSASTKAAPARKVTFRLTLDRPGQREAH